MGVNHTYVANIL